MLLNEADTLFVTNKNDDPIINKGRHRTVGGLEG